MLVEVEWERIEGDRNPLWGYCRCLYAYTDADRGRLLYIGKADRQTVRQRLHGDHKSDVFRFCECEFGVESYDCFHGAIFPEEGRRLTESLIGDVESLLIIRLQPPGNVACKSSRICRPGMRVKCTGDWLHRRTGFRDEY